MIQTLDNTIGESSVIDELFYEIIWLCTTDVIMLQRKAKHVFIPGRDTAVLVMKITAFLTGWRSNGSVSSLVIWDAS